MQSVIGFLVVNAILLAINLVFAGAIYGLFALGRTLVPEWMENPVVVYAMGLAALAVCLWFACWSIRIAPSLISRLRRQDQARAPE